MNPLINDEWSRVLGNNLWRSTYGDMTFTSRVVRMCDRAGRSY